MDTVVKSRCRLCSQTKELMDSHVIPEFLYKFLYDDKHKFYSLSTSDLENPGIHFKGMRESLLCSDCEQRFSKWETHASQKLVHRNNLEALGLKEGGFTINVDYTKFKLFELSILWRVGICSLKAFSKVNLGKHEKTIRRMLLNKDPGPYNLYGCAIYRPQDHREIINEWIESEEFDTPRGKVIRVTMAGMMWFYNVQSAPVMENWRHSFLQANGELRIHSGEHKITDQMISQFANAAKATRKSGTHQH